MCHHVRGPNLKPLQNGASKNGSGAWNVSAEINLLRNRNESSIPFIHSIRPSLNKWKWSSVCIC
jgi:hypothetical protein